MAVTVTHKFTAGSDVDGTGFSTQSWTPTANVLLLVSVISQKGSGTSPAPTLSGNGVTWVQVATRQATQSGYDSRITLFRSMGASPSTGSITITFGESQNDCAWSVNEVSNVNTSGTNGSGAVGGTDGTNTQTNQTSGTNTSLTVTLAAFDSANNGTFGAFYQWTPNAVTPGSGFSELGEVNVASAIIHQTEWKNSNDTGVDATWASNGDINFGIAVELNQAAAGDTLMAQALM